MQSGHIENQPPRREGSWKWESFGWVASNRLELSVIEELVQTVHLVGHEGTLLFFRHLIEEHMVEH